MPELFERLRRALPVKDQAWTGSGLQAGVMVALTDEEQPRVLLGRRGRHLRLHPGEIAFPGGKRESHDRGPWATALRETEEEVGIAAEMVEPVAELDSLITRSGFAVHPCVGRVPTGLDLRIDAREFDSVLSPQLATFAQAEHFRLEEYMIDGRPRMVPHYKVGEDDVWGVTAAVLVILVNVLYGTEFNLQRDWDKAP